ncbi:hypothetical protein SUGI_0192150 [Cryptomeria japonica]|nr:hypothetical protein SUGI_0192150 [Cryptomeria japonica]
MVASEGSIDGTAMAKMKKHSHDDEDNLCTDNFIEGYEPMDLDEEVQRRFFGLKRKQPLTGAEDNGHHSKRFQASRQVAKAREIYFEAKEEEAKLLKRSAKELERKLPVQRVEILMSSAPAPAAILWKMEELGFSITHGYGLIETMGLVVSYAWKMEWDRRPGKEKA